MKKQKLLLSICFLLFVQVTILVSPAFAAPAKKLWGFWNKSNQSNTATLDHNLWNELLLAHVSYDSVRKLNLVDYKNVPASDLQKLKNYISTMSSVDILTYNKKEQKAYWINLYNALTWLIVLRNNPANLKSIRNINEEFLKSPWDVRIAKIYDKDLTLNDIEHRILRPIWNDDRIHYALNCASISCPDIASTAFSGENTESLLDDARSKYINNLRGVKIEDNGNLTLSSLYTWYLEDFAKDKESLVSYILKYSSSSQNALIQSKWNNRISYAYDWDLNVR